MKNILFSPNNSIQDAMKKLNKAIEMYIDYLMTIVCAFGNAFRWGY